jgi:hypothetical protein
MEALQQSLQEAQQERDAVQALITEAAAERATAPLSRRIMSRRFIGAEIGVVQNPKLTIGSRTRFRFRTRQLA